MASSALLLTLAGFAQFLSSEATVIQVSKTPTGNASASLPESFVSFSIEFAYFPDFAGNISSPNTFSNNLLNNIGNLTGTKPYIRVGGNTQDYAIYNASLTEATYGIINPSRSADYPTTLYIGPSYFESYATWPDTKFTHGFNLGLGGNSTSEFGAAGWETLIETVPLACKALEGGKLLWWEYGNEPDLYSTSAQGPVRPADWNESTYVSQWLNGTRAIKAELEKNCPNLASNTSYGYIAPSFAGVNNHLKPVTTWADGLDADKDIKLISSHNYIGGATQPGVTLQGTLMNHSSTVASIALQTNLSSYLSYTGVPFILGETNSLYNEGASGLSNSFGAALWGVDFNLWCASVGIRRVHMHQGTNFRYASWQPVHTNITSIGTKAPYYGNIAVAAMLGNLTKGDVQIANLPLSDPMESAYAAYVNGSLKRVAAINMHAWNYTVNGTSDVVSTGTRPSRIFEFGVPEGYGEKVGVQRLHANGSDAITGITWDGWSFNWELDEGRPVRLQNVTVGEYLMVENGTVQVSVLDSTAAILYFGEG